MKSFRFFFIILVFFLVIGTGCSSQQDRFQEPAGGSANTAAEVDTSDAIRIQIEIQDFGTIKADLYPHTAPATVENFVRLINEHFYDGLTFHRVINGFMIQGGDPLGNGRGGSEENIIGEFYNNGFENGLSHSRGVLSMARAGNDNNSASSQFFIVQAESSFLDGDYAAFGMVTEGIEVVDKIALETMVEDDNGTVLPANQPVIKSIAIID